MSITTKEETNIPSESQTGCGPVWILLLGVLMLAVPTAFYFLSPQSGKTTNAIGVSAVQNLSFGTFVAPKQQNEKQPAATKISKKKQFPNSICNLLDEEPVGSTEHPLDTPLKVAQTGKELIQKQVKDYTATIIKQERIGNKLAQRDFMFCKIRNERKNKLGKVITPLSVYLRYTAPESVKGREVLWVQGKNGNKLTARSKVPLLGWQVVPLKPTSFIAMQGQKYPITEIGIMNLAVKMIEKGERDRKQNECEVNIDRSAIIEGRPCTTIEIVHPVKRKHFEFHVARISIDDELNVPIQYASYSWPKEKGGKPVLEEKYTYKDLKLNVGLTDKDFDLKNPEYNFGK